MIESAPLVAIPNAKQPLPGVLTGGKPSEAQLREAHAAGYRTVISLLPANETVDEAEQAKALGLSFVTIPIAGAADLTEDNARRLSQARAAAAGAPIIIHCGSGNRVGALMALEAFYVDHADAAEALELGRRAGLTALEPAVKTQLEAAAPRPAP